MSENRLQPFEIVVEETESPDVLLEEGFDRPDEKDRAEYVAEVRARLAEMKEKHDGPFPIEFDAIRAESDPVLRHDIAAAQIDSARWKVGQRIAAELKEKGVRKIKVAEVCGCHPSQLTRALSGQFMMPPDSLVILCNRFLFRTVHETMFGAPMVTQLPKHLSLLARELTSAKADVRSELHSRCQEILMGSKTAANISRPDDAVSVLKERVIEFADDRYCFVTNAPGRRYVSQLSMAVRKLTLLRDDGKNHIGSLLFFMQMAIELGTSLDYLMVRNYARFGDVSYQNKRGGYSEVNNRKVKEIIEMLLDMPEEAMQQFLNEAWSQLIGKF